MTTPAIPLATAASPPTPTLAVALPGATRAFAALFGAESDATEQASTERQDDATGGKALPRDGEITDVVPPAMLAWLLAPVPIVAGATAGGTAPDITRCGTAPSAAGLAAPFTTNLTGAPATPRRAAPSAAATPPTLPPDAPTVRPTPPLPGSLAMVGAGADAPMAAHPQSKPVAGPLAEPTLPAPRATLLVAPRTPALTAAATPFVAQTAAEPAPAARVFAAAIHQLIAPPERDGAESTSTPFAALSVLDATPAAVAALAASGDAQLDMADRRWPEAMIARIGALRDASDALAATADVGKDKATLRLSPDALGTVEVSLHREEDQVRVHLTAEQPRTQALLADAQPRLIELAEARGIRVVQAGAASLGSESGAASQQRGQAAAPTAPTRNRTHADDASAASDHRIA